MDFLKNLPELKPMQVLKVVGIILAALFVLAFAFQIIGSSFRSFSENFGISVSAPGYGGGGGYATEDAAYNSYSKGEVMPQLSSRNVAGIYPPQPGSPAGDNAEEFEVTQYNANIETRHLKDTCDSIAALKARKEVIFENANTQEKSCNFTFKVKHESVDEILVMIKNLDPKDLSESTYTIKWQIDDFTNEVDVLMKKRASIDETLSKALRAYDEITALATRTENADALAKIINSKISIIERMTQERININEQLDRLSRAKADQLDRLDYTYFNVNVYENKFVDGQQLKDSWKESIKNFVRDVNDITQNLTTNLVLLLLLIVQWAIYALIVLFVAKFGWKIGKNIWDR